MAFKDNAWLQTQCVTLATITLADPDGVRDSGYTSDPGASPVLRFCDAPAPYTYDSNIYYPGILSWTGMMSGSAFSGRRSDADGTLVLATNRYVWQKKGAAAPAETSEYQVRLGALMRSYLWSGAAVVVTVIAEMPSGSQAAQQVFTGRIHDPSLTIDAMTFQCVEDKEYNRRKPDADGPANATSSTRWIVNDTDYPDAPLDQVGKSMPLVYTDQPGFIESGDPSLCINPKYLRGLWPAIVSDNKYVVADYSVATLQAYHTTPTANAGPTLNTFMYVPELDTVAPMYNSGTGGATDAYHKEYWITDDNYAILYINPDRFVSKTADVTNVEYAFDGVDITYASLANDGTPADVNFLLSMPNLNALGKIIDLQAFVQLYPGTGVGGTDATVNGTFGIWDNAVSGYPVVGATNLTKANVRDGGFINGTAWGLSNVTATAIAPTIQNYRWAYDSGTVENPLTFRINITSSGATANVRACGIKVKFLPKNYSVTQVTNINEFRDRYHNGGDLDLHPGKGWFTRPNPNGSQFFFTADFAQVDDNSGDITGSADGGITSPPLIFKHFIWKMCSNGTYSSSNFRSSGFGSFATCVTDLATIATDTMCMRILEPMTPDELISRISSQTPLHIGRSMYDSKWYAVAYQQSPSSDKYFLDVDGSTNYKWKYTEDIIEGSVQVGFTPLDDCVNEVHVRAAPFSPTGQYTQEAWIGPSGSSDGDGGDFASRESVAAGSRDDLHIKGTISVDLPDLIWPQNAAYCQYLFDRYNRPRMTVSFTTGLRGIGLEPGMATLIDNEMQDYIPIPYYPGDGVGGGTAKEWDDVKFFVRDVSLVSGSGAGGAPFLVNVTLEEIR